MAPKKTIVKKKPAAKKPAAKRTPTAKKAAPKKAATKTTLADRLKKTTTTTAKKAAPKRTPAKKAAPKRKPIAFEMMKSNQNTIIKEFEEMQTKYDEFGTALGEYVYDGKKKNAAISRALLMDITKLCKSMRISIQESKDKLKPIYKEA